jgi:hypothetical protein
MWIMPNLRRRNATFKPQQAKQIQPINTILYLVTLERGLDDMMRIHHSSSRKSTSLAVRR